LGDWDEEKNKTNRTLFRGNLQEIIKSFGTAGLENTVTLLTENRDLQVFESLKRNQNYQLIRIEFPHKLREQLFSVRVKCLNLDKLMI